MHGDMSQNARQRALRQFESGKVAVLVATDVAARGLDLDDITHVINYDPPAEDKGYVHRTGRTGRAGRSGTAITLVLPDQQADTSRAARRLGHGERYEQSGLESARAKVVYTSRRGRRSKWCRSRRLVRSVSGAGGWDARDPGQALDAGSRARLEGRAAARGLLGLLLLPLLLQRLLRDLLAELLGLVPALS